MEIPQGWHLPSSSWVSRAPRPPFNICIWFKSPSTPSFQLSCHAWRTKLDLCQVNPFSSPIYLIDAENSWCTLTMTNATRECFRKEGIRLKITATTWIWSPNLERSRRAGRGKDQSGATKRQLPKFWQDVPCIQMIFRFLENHDHDFSKTNLRLWESVAISMQSHWRPHCYLCCVAKTTFNGRGIEANVGN